MLGRVRAASSSPESLEMERPTSNKILKHHSLSVYEATLMKLRQGSRLSTAVASPLVDEAAARSPMESMADDPGFQHRIASPDEDAMNCDTGCILSRPAMGFAAGDSVGSAGPRPSRDASIVYLFSKYKLAHSAVGSPSSNGEALGAAGCSTATGSTYPVTGHCPDGTSSLPVGMM